MIRVIIERKVKPDNLGDYQELLSETRKNAQITAGYVSGESLINTEDKSQWITISTWESVEAWNAWYASSARQELTAKMGPFLVADEKVSIYELFWA